MACREGEIVLEGTGLSGGNKCPHPRYREQWLTTLRKNRQQPDRPLTFVSFSSILRGVLSGAAPPEQQLPNCHGGNPKTASNSVGCGPPYRSQFPRPRDLWSLPSGSDSAEEVAIPGMSLKCARHAVSTLTGKSEKPLTTKDAKERKGGSLNKLLPCLALKAGHRTTCATH